ncbi:nitrite/sulfite reductase [Asaccharospora irregularis]|uniref:Sulfite reductase (Ferredoxin) n=1 Tax=Asaccharospora irregularis DSM 2635 TaxID=1121321 RepID=A0A1M5KAH2_9FIRM|nr:nitrite/sulfite reductase [Asaccharospora irregularis]SHG49894.1 sulfite reductase (ferredoxin) [Asaccharospora irregularis DSM 2635]
MIRITDEMINDIEEFRKSAELCEKDELDVVEYRKRIVAMGVYKQRVKGTYMVRLRATGGVIELNQLQAVSEAAKKHGHGRIHFTTRQDIQFQALPIDNIYNVMKDVIKVDITTKGACGDTVRNVGCSPLSGVALDEVFDVTPYVKAVINHLIKDPTALQLPRKYKIAFSNTKEDTGKATMVDLGFVAKINNGVRGFEVYGAGGFGKSPIMALKLADFIEDKDILYYAQAMMEVFDKEGDRNNRHKARIRYILHRLGDDKFLELFNSQLQKVKSEVNLDFNMDEEDIKNDIEPLQTLQEVNQILKDNEKYKNILFAQKQLGYYSVYIHPEGGNLDSKDLDKLIGFLNNLGYEVSIRLTTTQGFVVRDLKFNDAKELINITSNISSIHNIDNSVACIGHTTCSLGICLSQNLLASIRETFKEADEKVKSTLPKVFISGCPNSCGQHQQGMIGLSGRAKNTADGLVPAYSVSFGGKLGAGIAKIGETYGDIPAKKIPGFVLELANLKVTSNFEDFEEFLENKRDEIKDLIEKYSNIESFIENPDLYYDFGCDEKFAVKK